MATRVRSPKYPSIDLETAIRRAREFYAKERRSPANVKVAIAHWKYAPGSSSGQQAVSAMKEFGLMEDSGSKDARTVKLTNLALRILLDEREGSRERQAAIQEAALNPTIHNSIWEAYDGHLPSDENLRHRLVFDWETPFNERTVDGFIRELHATLDFAGLASGDTISADEGDTGTDAEGGSDPIRVGDYVQWESQGVLQFAEPKRVRALSDDGQWAFVDGSETGMPVDELTVEKRPEGKAKTEPPRLPLPPGESGGRVFEDNYSTPSGSIRVEWPAQIDAESEDIEAWLKILTRKIGRAVKKKSEDSE